MQLLPWDDTPLGMIWRKQTCSAPILVPTSSLLAVIAAANPQCYDKHKPLATELFRAAGRVLQQTRYQHRTFPPFCFLADGGGFSAENRRNVSIFIICDYFVYLRVGHRLVHHLVALSDSSKKSGLWGREIYSNTPEVRSLRTKN